MSEDKILQFTNPATGEVFGQVQMATPEQIAQAYTELKNITPAWSNKPVRERVHILQKFQRVLIDSLDEITDILNQDCGKTRQDGMIEVFVTVDMLDNYRKHAERWLKPRRVPSGLYLFKSCYVLHRPYGVVSVIAPWNYPLALSIPPVVSALLAGNTVMLKPSEVTGATGVLIEKLFSRVPELAPYVRVLHGDGSVGAEIVQTGPDYIFLTGSTPTGKVVMRAAADKLIPVACELGGKDAMIVLEDADIAAAARWGVWGANFNTGQTCMSVERVYVVEPVYEKFVQLAVNETQKLKIGYSQELESPFYLGPITDPRQVKTIKHHLNDALEKGARLLVGGKITNMFVEPVVLVDVNHTMLVMQEETFGPLLPIVKVRDEEEAIRMANDCAYGLGASVWSRDLERAQRVARRIEASSIVVNDTIAQFGVPMLPFGGIKSSGYGRIHGKEGLIQFTRPYAYAVGQAPFPWDVGTILREPGHYKAGATIMHLVFGTSLKQRIQPVIKRIDQINVPQSRKRAAFGLGLAGVVMGLVFGLIRLVNKSNRI